MATQSKTNRRVAIEHLLEWTDEIASGEITQAINQLEATDDLTDAQRAVVADLGQRLSHRIVAAPVTALEQADPSDEMAIDKALQLFDMQAFEDTSDR